MLKRSGFNRAPVTEPKPAPGQRMRKCVVCREPFAPRSMTHKACGPECATVHGIKVAAAQKAKAQRQERAQDKVKRDSMKTYPELVRDTQKAFNEFVRLRDAGQPCICCGRETTKVSGLHTHGWDCGHYRSTGSAPHLRFNEDNAHRQLVFCNRNRSGNAVEYRIGLIARIGLERVEALESDNRVRKWSSDDLRAMKAEYQLRVREMKGKL